MTSTPPPTAPPLPPSAPTRPQLRRSGTEKMAGGVCGGLAEYSGVDPLLWRVGFVALTVLGGSGLLIYLMLWVLMPMGNVPADYRPNAVDGLVDRLHTGLSGLSQRRGD
ncbi:MAG: phage shock protein [Blastococcus sp.]|jgi:phage shock protein C|nr:phage shock protein [Blastococcus sp.]